ncbi:MAG: DNA gyrase inhibitor YacG [Gammaproteobacteria bacterium]|nr:DNA gyrase inhibitor YacG [Gammaproteobacteria bacterium]
MKPDSKEKTVNCPTCNKLLEWSSSEPYRPFCSQRCKLIDLGDWASEGHRIAGEPDIDLLDESDYTNSDI